MSSAGSQILIAFWHHLQAHGCLPQEQGKVLEKGYHTLKGPVEIKAPSGGFDKELVPQRKQTQLRTLPSTYVLPTPQVPTTLPLHRQG